MGYLGHWGLAGLLEGLMGWLVAGMGGIGHGWVEWLDGWMEDEHG